MERAVLECRGLGKRFGGALALSNVDFDLRPGEIHGLVGSNGAGKSTLLRILSGALPDHEGTIHLDGRPVQLASPHRALQHGIAMVYQELSGIGPLSVAENLFLGRHPIGWWGSIDWRRIRREAREALAQMDVRVDVQRRLDRFPLVTRQTVEIVRALHRKARVLILDEPTSALSPPETARLFERVRQLPGRGVSVIFVSHFIEDVLQLCDRVTVLRDGRVVESAPARELSKQGVIHSMLGHRLEGEEAAYEKGVRLPPRTARPPVLEARNLNRRNAFSEINLQVAPGECLGLYGFVGAGHMELVHTLAGAQSPHRGQILLDGVPLTPGRPKSAVARGIVLVAADREKTVVRGAPVYQNVTLAHLRRTVGGWLTRRREKRVAEPVLRQVQCRPARPSLKARLLSGGNQQKIVFAKWLLGPVRVLLLEEPTRGMDVGAKEEIVRLVADLKEQGAAVILASSEPELVLAHADRILVLRRGRVIHEFVDGHVDKRALMNRA